MADNDFKQGQSGIYTPGRETGAPDRTPDVSGLSDEQTVEHYRRQFEQSVGEHPTSTLLAAFGVGIGLGVVLGSSLGRALFAPEPKSYSEEIGEKLAAAYHDAMRSVPDVRNPFGRGKFPWS